MWPKIVNFELILIYFLLLIPWPHTEIIKIFCSKDNSRLVRKIVRSKWTPILDKYQVKLPLECPLHPFRDLFAPRQDAKKRDRPTQWTCRKCGKSFYKEKFLDLHFETRHKYIINKDEDAVCLADFCDIMRCEVFQSEESSSLAVGDSHIVTDIEVWGDSLGQNSALAKANAAYLSLIPLRTSASGASRASKVQQNRQLCQDKIGQNKHKDITRDTNDDKKEHAERPRTTNDSIKKRSLHAGHTHSSSSSSSSSSTSSTSSTFAPVNSQNAAKSDKSKSNAKSSATNQSNQLDSDDDETHNETNSSNSNTSSSTSSAGESNENSTQNGNAQNMQKVRANCRAEELSKLKVKCEYLVRSCIAGLLLSMTDHAFKEMEEEMNKAVCWYLSCDRYWEDGPLEPRAFPWGLIVILVFVLSTGICFCYYIIWILFDSEESTINANHQQHYMQYPPQHQPQQHYQQHGSIHSVPQQHYYYQQQQPHDLYPEQPRYEYRHSPRRFADRPTHQGTPTAGSQQQAQALMYQQDIYDRRDYTNRATTTTIPTSVVGGSHNHPVEETAAAMAANDGGTRHYNPNHHHSSLDAHHRHVGSSQTSLRGSASAHEIIQSEVGHNEHYIYVTYPPDLKKRFFEKYE